MNSISKKADSNSVPYLWLHQRWNRKLKGVNKWIAKLCLTTEKNVSTGLSGSALTSAATGRNSMLHGGLCLRINTPPFLESRDLWVRRWIGLPVQLPQCSPPSPHTALLFACLSCLVFHYLPEQLIPALDRLIFIMISLTSGSLARPPIAARAIRVSLTSLSGDRPWTVHWSWPGTPAASAPPM